MGATAGLILSPISGTFCYRGERPGFYQNESHPMANVTVLDGNRHRALRVRNGLRLQAYDGLGSLPIVPAELDAAHKEFPLFARKHPDTGRFLLCAIVGSQPDRNEFLSERGDWRTRYVPLYARRGPFLMHADDSGVRLCVDLDDPRVGGDGERLYDDAGQPAAYARQIASIMRTIHDGEQQTLELTSALAAQQLLEPIQIAHPGELLRGLYSVNPDRLKALDAAALTALNAAGHLQAAYFLASSVGNLSALLTPAPRATVPA